MVLRRLMIICTLGMAMLLIAACGPSPADQITAYFDQFGPWEATVEEPTRVEGDEVSYVRSKPITGQNYAQNYRYSCQLYEVNRSAMFRNVFVPGFTVADVLPGALIEGQSLRDGEIDILPIARNDVNMRVDVSIEDATLTVPSPAAPDAIYDAVTTIRREANPYLNDTDVDIIAANLEYRITEAYSYEQAMLDMGLSAEYAGESVSVNFDSSFSSEQSVETHTIMATLFHPMYTIVFDDSEMTPAGFFADDVKMADIEQLAARDRIGPDNLPLYIKSVTYGQMILFTVSNSSVETTEELQVAVSGAVGAFKGEATLDQSYESIMRNSDIQVYSIGGDRDAAFAALRAGDLSLFFAPGESTTAEVLYMTANTLNGDSAALVDRASFTERDCTAGEALYPEWYVVVDNTDDTRVYVGSGNNTRQILRQESGRGQVLLNAYLPNSGVQTFEVWNNLNCWQTQANVSVYRGTPSNPANKRYEVNLDRVDGCIGFVQVLSFRIYADNPQANCEYRADFGVPWHSWDGNTPIWRPCS